MKKHLDQIQLDIRTCRTMEEVRVLLSDVDGLERNSNYYVNSDEFYFINLPSLERRLRFDECYSLVFKEIDEHHLSYTLGIVNRFIDYLAEACENSNIYRNSIDYDYIMLFGNPFIQDAELLKKYNIPSSVLSYYIHTTGKQDLTNLAFKVKELRKDRL